MAINQEGGYANFLLEYLMTEVSEEELESIFKLLSPFQGENRKRLYQGVACNELVTDTTIVIYRGGILGSRLDEVCKNNEMVAPFDSKKWQVSSKIIYVSGTHDIATSFSHTEYHFNNQLSKNKTLICVESAGHSPILTTLSSCNQSVWSAMLTGDNSKIQETLSKCDASANISSVEACKSMAVAPPAE